MSEELGRALSGFLEAFMGRKDELRKEATETERWEKAYELQKAASERDAKNDDLQYMINMAAFEANAEDRTVRMSARAALMKALDGVDPEVYEKLQQYVLTNRQILTESERLRVEQAKLSGESAGNQIGQIKKMSDLVNSLGQTANLPQEVYDVMSQGVNQLLGTNVRLTPKTPQRLSEVNQAIEGLDKTIATKIANGLDATKDLLARQAFVDERNQILGLNLPKQYSLEPDNLAQFRRQTETLFEVLKLLPEDIAGGYLFEGYVDPNTAEALKLGIGQAAEHAVHQVFPVPKGHVSGVRESTSSLKSLFEMPGGGDEYDAAAPPGLESLFQGFGGVGGGQPTAGNVAQQPAPQGPSEHPLGATGRDDLGLSKFQWEALQGIADTKSAIRANLLPLFEKWDRSSERLNKPFVDLYKKGRSSVETGLSNSLSDGKSVLDKADSTLTEFYDKLSELLGPYAY